MAQHLKRTMRARRRSALANLQQLRLQQLGVAQRFLELTHFRLRDRLAQLVAQYGEIDAALIKWKRSIGLPCLSSCERREDKGDRVHRYL